MGLGDNDQMELESDTFSSGVISTLGIAIYRLC